MPKPVSLSLHRNNRARRQAKEIRRELRIIADNVPRTFTKPVTGYVCVLWSEDGEGTAYWMGGDELAPVMIEDHAMTIMRRKIAMKDTKHILEDED